MKEERGNERGREQHDPRRRVNGRESRLAAPADDAIGHGVRTDRTAEGTAGLVQSPEIAADLCFLRLMAYLAISL